MIFTWASYFFGAAVFGDVFRVVLERARVDDQPAPPSSFWSSLVTYFTPTPVQADVDISVNVQNFLQKVCMIVAWSTAKVSGYLVWMSTKFVWTTFWNFIYEWSFVFIAIAFVLDMTMKFDAWVWKTHSQGYKDFLLRLIHGCIQIGFCFDTGVEMLIPLTPGSAMHECFCGMTLDWFLGHPVFCYYMGDVFTTAFMLPALIVSVLTFSPITTLVTILFIFREAFVSVVPFGCEADRLFRGHTLCGKWLKERIEQPPKDYTSWSELGFWYVLQFVCNLVNKVGHVASTKNIKALGPVVSTKNSMALGPVVVETIKAISPCPPSETFGSCNSQGLSSCSSQGLSSCSSGETTSCSSGDTDGEEKKMPGDDDWGVKCAGVVVAWALCGFLIALWCINR